MEDRPWWPRGIVQNHDESEIITSWGTTPLWLDDGIHEASWWNSKETTWGDWPEVESVTLHSEDHHGMWIDIGAHIALVIPIPTGNHCSRLVRNAKLNNAVKDFLDLPIAGLSDPEDRVLIYSKSDVPEKTGERVGELHTSLIAAGFSTPNDQKGWNARLKIVEDRLKTNTLWRAAHNLGTIGVPRIHLGATMRPLPIPLSESLLLEDAQLPALRDAVGLSLDGWSRTIGPRYSSRNVMRTSTGGIAHMRYDVMLMAKAESFAFAEDSSVIDAYLSKVDRLQAKLGTMRLVRMGIPFSLACGVVGIMLERIGEISSANAPLLIFVGIAIASKIVHDLVEPDWRQEF